MVVNGPPPPGKLRAISEDEYARRMVAQEIAESEKQMEFLDRWLAPLVLGVLVIVCVPLIPIVAPVWLLGWLAMRVVPWLRQ